MEWLQNITLPQSLEHIELLQFMLVISLFIFISFISIIFWGTGLSLFFKVNEKKHLDDKYRRMAKDIIELVTIN